MVRRGGIQQLSCHVQSQSVPVPGGGKVKFFSPCFSLKSPGIRADRPLTAAKNTPDTADRR